MKVNLLQTVLLIAILGYCTRSAAQNYVPNWSFELIDSCPPGHNVGNNNWVVQNWQRPLGSITTPDLFSTCYNGTTPTPPYQDVSVPTNFMGFANPKTGDNYMGALLRYGTFREYIQVQLISPLVSGQKYLCGFNVQRADSSEFQVDKVGMHISNVAEWQNTNQAMSNLTPQIENVTGIMYDSLNWLNVEDIFIATGGEQYITIGNFYTNVNTLVDSIEIGAVGGTGWNVCCRGYYLFDDVYIFPYEENLQAEFPNQACSGETITLSATGSAKYDWYIDGAWYSSDSTISFIAEQSAQISVTGYEDSLSHFIEVIDCPIDCSGEPIIPNVFTPNGDNINDFFHPNEINAGCYTITIINRWGNQIYHCDRDQSVWDGTAMNGEHVIEGVYFYIVEVEDNFGVKRIYHGHVTVSR